ncbi:MAG TPA: hypothetical protein VF770_06100 [Solirubrobacterales bacterium]
MATRLTAVAAVLAVALAAAALAAAALVGIYRNGMDNEAQRGQVVRLYGQRCAQGAFGKALRIAVGKRTRECGYRTPVIGRNLDISATERLLGTTPKPLQHGAFVALNLRSGEDGSGYQLAVYPLQQKVQLRKVLPGGGVKYLAIVRNVSTVKGLEGTNSLRLRAFDTGTGPGGASCRILAFVGGQLVAAVTDEAATELKGRAAGFSIGAASAAKGAAAAVDNVVVNAPSPF